MSELKNIQEIENKLFKRKEIQVDLEADSVPKTVDVIKMISEKFSTPVENITISDILGKFGSQTFTVRANVYESREALEGTEAKHKIPKIEEKPAEETTIEATPEAEAPKEEAQAEEKPAENTEEAKQEEPKE